MYSRSRFNCAKSELVDSYLYPATTADCTKQVELLFLRSLLSAAALKGQVTQDDIQRAIEHSGVCDFSPEIADRMLRKLMAIGDHYLGTLSRQQTAELRRLRQLCILAAATNDALAWQQIAEIL